MGPSKALGYHCLSSVCSVILSPVQSLVVPTAFDDGARMQGDPVPLLGT